MSLLQAVGQYWLECVILVLVMFLGILLGKFFRNVKEYGFWEAIRMITKAKKNVE